MLTFFACLRRSAAFLVPLFVAASAFAALPAGITQGPTVEGITEYKLANGLTVLLFPDASKPSTVVNVTYRVGSRHENYGETGMAHLLEHLVFKGTPSRGNIQTELGKRGMRYNGSTSFDRTNYFETFTTSSDNLDWALGMEADRMVNSYIRKSDLDAEMTVVRNEFESGETSPQRVLWGKMLASAYMWHNYGHSTIGARSDIENVDISRLQAFYRTYYQPDNAVLVVAGKFDVDPTLGLIAKYFGAIPKPTRALPTIYTEEPVQDGERRVSLRRVGNAKILGMMYHTVRGADPDAVAVDALGEVMTLAPAGRLYKALVDTKKATAIDAWGHSGVDPGMFAFFIHIPETQSIEPAYETALATFANVAKEPITEAELARVKVKAAKSFDEVMANPQAFGIAISESIAAGDWRLFFLQRDLYRKVTPADVQRVALAYLKPANLTVGEFVPDASPDRAPVPPVIDVAALVKDYKGEAMASAGEEFDPSPANLDARTQRFTLANGMKVALLPKKTRGESVRFNAVLHFGDLQSVTGKRAVGDFTATLLNHGTAKHSRQEFEDALDRLRAKVSASGGPTSAGVSGQTYRAQLPDTLRLVAEMLRQPAFPADELAKEQREQLREFDASRTEPQEVATRALRRHGNPYPAGDPRYVPTLDEDIASVKAVTRDDLVRFHSQFYGAGNAEIAIVGDFDAAVIRALLTELFGDWKAAQPYTRVPDPFRPNDAAVLKFELADKANAFLIGRERIQFNDSSPDYPAMLVVSHILGESGSSRIFERLRQQDGLSYGAGTFFQPAAQDDNSAIGAYAIFAPENLARVRTGFAEEFDRALKDGFTDAEVANARDAVLQTRKLGRSDDGRLAGALANQEYLGRTFALSGSVDAAIAKLTTADVNAALRKYLKPGEFAYAFAGTFDKK
jgi:zinc protease